MEQYRINAQYVVAQFCSLDRSAKLLALLAAKRLA
jgi:hypothetical protein